MRRVYQVNHDTQRATDLGPATRPHLAKLAAERRALDLTTTEIEAGHRYEIRSSFWRCYVYDEVIANIGDPSTETLDERREAYAELDAAGHFADCDHPWYRPVLPVTKET